MTKDPICGMTVDEATALPAERDGETFYFCSEQQLRQQGQIVAMAGDGITDAPALAAGTIIGNAPVVNGPLVVPASIANLVRISQFRILSGATSAPVTAGRAGVGEVTINWFALPASAYAIETSNDLIHWSAVTATIKEPVPGYYQAHFPMPPGERAFFRVRTAMTTAGFAN